MKNGEIKNKAKSIHGLKFVIALCTQLFLF